jgi:hypothetical protein
MPNDEEIEYLVKLVDTNTGEKFDPQSGPTAFEAGHKAAEAAGRDPAGLKVEGIVLSADEMRPFTADEEAAAREGAQGG